MVLFCFSEELRVLDLLYKWCLKLSRCPCFLPVSFYEGGGEGGGADGDVSLSLAHVVTPTAVGSDQTWGGPTIPLGSQRLQRAATPTGQEGRAVDNCTSGLSTGVVTENRGFVGSSAARETHAVSGMRLHG